MLQSYITISIFSPLKATHAITERSEDAIDGALDAALDEAFKDTRVRCGVRVIPRQVHSCSRLLIDRKKERERAEFRAYVPS